jgi:hypothetical protein
MRRHATSAPGVMYAAIGKCVHPAGKKPPTPVSKHHKTCHSHLSLFTCATPCFSEAFRVTMNPRNFRKAIRTLSALR